MATNNAINSSKPVGVPSGGTGSTTFTAHGVLLGEGTSAVASTGAASTGQTLMGNTGADPAFTGSPSFSGSVTAGTGLTVTSGDAAVSAGNITMAATNTARTQGTLVVGGDNVLQFDGTNNSFTGKNAGGSITSGAQNCGCGALALEDIQTGQNNTAIGYGALSDTATAFGCTSAGYLSMGNVSGAAQFNTAIGYQSGTQWSTNESSNICIGSNGITGESNTIRLGSNAAGSGPLQQNACFITGIDGVNIGSVAKVVTMASGQLGTATITAGSNITITPGANTITIAASGGASGIGTLNGNTGSATGSTVTIAGGSNISTSATGSTLTAALVSSPSVSGSVTAGTGFNATSGNVTITAGNIVFTADSTSSSASVITLDGLSFLSAFGTAGSTDQNLFLGVTAGNFTLSGAQSNVGIGYSSLSAISSGASNVCVGSATGFSLVGNSTDAGTANTIIGDTAGESLIGITLNTANNNVAIGAQALTRSTSSNNVIAIGVAAGNNYTTTESSNIVIANSGTLAESHVIKIGTNGSGNGQQNKCFIAGITGQTVTGSTVLCSTAGQLGTVSSSERFKENIVDMGDESSQLYNLRPVLFNFKDDPKKSMSSGLIAEEVDKVMPDLVVYDDDHVPYSVKYHEIPAMLLNEIKKLRSRIEALEKERI